MKLVNESVKSDVEEKLENFEASFNETNNILCEIKKKVERYEKFSHKVNALQAIVRIFKEDLDGNQEISIMNVIRDLNEVGQHIECEDMIEKQRNELLEILKEISEDFAILLEKHHNVKINQNLDISKSLDELNDFVSTTNQGISQVSEEVFSEEVSVENVHQSLGRFKDVLTKLRRSKNLTGAEIQQLYKLHSLIQNIRISRNQFSRLNSFRLFDSRISW